MNIPSFQEECAFYLFRIYCKLRAVKSGEGLITQFMEWKKFNYSWSKANSRRMYDEGTLF